MKILYAWIDFLKSTFFGDIWTIMAIMLLVQGLKIFFVVLIYI